MQTPAHLAAAADPPSDRGYVARLSATLAAMLARVAGAELSEDELLLRLGERWLITYPPATRAQGLSAPHRIPHHRNVRLSAALAEELAGPYLPRTKYALQIFTSAA